MTVRLNMYQSGLKSEPRENLTINTGANSKVRQDIMSIVRIHVKTHSGSLNLNGSAQAGIIRSRGLWMVNMALDSLSSRKLSPYSV